MTAPRFATQSEWRTPACTLLGDVLALMLAFVAIVMARHAVIPSYSIRSCLEVFPCLGIVIVAFWAQGLYPGVLIHPAEEMRRVFLCISLVALGMASTTFLWRNAEAYSRSVFLVGVAGRLAERAFSALFIARLAGREILVGRAGGSARFRPGGAQSGAVVCAMGG